MMAVEHAANFTNLSGDSSPKEKCKTNSVFLNIGHVFLHTYLSQGVLGCPWQAKPVDRYITGGERTGKGKTMKVVSLNRGPRKVDMV